MLPVRLLDLVMTSAAVAGVSGRRDKTARLADLLHARFPIRPRRPRVRSRRQRENDHSRG